MPEFILETGPESSTRLFKALDAFTQGYIEALFFTNEEPSVTLDDVNADRAAWNHRREEGQISELPCDVGFAELSPDAFASIVADCVMFQKDNAALLQEAYDAGYDKDYDSAAAGRDFWFTRNGHGVGFWDRGLGDIGSRLTDACRPWRELYAYLGDDDLVYVD